MVKINDFLVELSGFQPAVHGPIRGLQDLRVCIRGYGRRSTECKDS